LHQIENLENKMEVVVENNDSNKMRTCQTIQDLAELLADHDTVLELTDGFDLYIRFIEQFKQRFNICQVRCHRTKTDFGHRAKYAIQSLLNSPEFWRKTTVADQLGRFALSNTDFGKLKVTKRARQPLTITCETPRLANKLYNALKKRSE
jgi:hypothetical protein